MIDKKNLGISDTEHLDLLARLEDPEKRKAAAEEVLGRAIPDLEKEPAAIQLLLKGMPGQKPAGILSLLQLQYSLEHPDQGKEEAPK